MAFSNTVTDIIPFGNGYIAEYGTWNGSGVTTGTITAASSGTYTANKQYITEILFHCQASNGDTAVTPDRNPTNGLNKLKLTFTSGDTGTYTIIGKAR